MEAQPYVASLSGRPSASASGGKYSVSQWYCIEFLSTKLPQPATTSASSVHTSLGLELGLGFGLGVGLGLGL